MPKIDEKDKQVIQDMFSGMKGNVYVRFFSAKEECDYCKDTQEILEELSALSDKIDIRIFDKEGNADEVSRYNVDKFPATVFVKEDGSDTGVRFYGIPSGYEFSSLIEDIIDLGNDSVQLSEATINQLATITEDLHIQVFVTPTCPHCPRSVRLAHQMAMINPHIRGDMIEAMEFPELSNRFNVMGVPKSVFNDGKAEQEGSVPEEMFLQKIQEALQK